MRRIDRQAAIAQRRFDLEQARLAALRGAELTPGTQVRVRAGWSPREGQIGWVLAAEGARVAVEMADGQTLSFEAEQLEAIR